MTRRRLYLLRHGDVAYFPSNGERVSPNEVSLTERGRAQAIAAGALLRDVPFDAVVTSRLRRTHETAELVLGGRNLPHRIEPGFDEIAPGNVLALGEGQAIADAIVNAFVRAPEPGATFLAGERFDAFHERVATTLARLFDEAGWSTLLVVAHGGVNRAILGEVLGAGLHAYGAIEQEPACINVVDVDDATVVPPRRAFLRLLNHTPYDAGKTGTRRTTMEELLAAFAR